jgi:hypothetical protein
MPDTDFVKPVVLRGAQPLILEGIGPIGVVLRIFAFSESMVYEQRIHVVVGDELAQAKSQLVHIVNASDSSRVVLCAEQGRKEKASQDCDNGDDHQEFNKAECWLSTRKLAG